MIASVDTSKLLKFGLGSFRSPAKFQPPVNLILKLLSHGEYEKLFSIKSGNSEETNSIAHFHLIVSARLRDTMIIRIMASAVGG